MSHAVCTRKNGFTLIEILAVLTIMTIVASLLVAAAIGARRKADSDAAQAGVTFIASQIDAYLNKRGQLPDSGLSYTTEADIYDTLAQWGFEVIPDKQVDPWGNPFVIVLSTDYGVNFPLQSGGACYSTPPFDRMYGMYDPPPAAPDDEKQVHEGDPATTPAYNGQANGYQVISAGPDGMLSRNGGDDWNADNFTNW
jgi:prepilin-type N-terminal cleavage/methylation domain-containing protein